MRALAVILSFASACGRSGFASDGGDSGVGNDAAVKDSASADSVSHTIKRVQTFAPGAGPAPVMFSVDQTAGDFMIAATYVSNGTNAIASSLGETWNTLPGENVNCPGSILFSLRFFYAQLSSSGTNSISIAEQSSGSIVGAFLIEYSGVAGSNPIDNSSGDLSPNSAADFDGGQLQLDAAEEVVAAFVFQADATLTAGAGMIVEAQDDSFNAMLDDAFAPAGTFTATAALPSSTTAQCWAGSSVALRPE